MSIAHTTATVIPIRTTLTSPLIFLLAASTGLSVAALYYSQPTLGVLATDLHASNQAVGWIPTLTQFGYALGLLFLAPLGDRFDRRTIIVVKSLLLAMALLAIAAAPSLSVLLGASLAVGLLATVAQDIVPAAATLAPGGAPPRPAGGPAGGSERPRPPPPPGRAGGGGGG
ncbi:MFS transporter, partial [Massilia sp. CT11-108]|uniref:MFS transporter n=1 Tax=Massilia sp. CT11-108 TaxID=3393900 RepID=UPI0039A6714B